MSCYLQSRRVWIFCDSVLHEEHTKRWLLKEAVHPRLSQQLWPGEQGNKHGIHRRSGRHTRCYPPTLRSHRMCDVTNRLADTTEDDQHLTPFHKLDMVQVESIDRMTVFHDRCKTSWRCCWNVNVCILISSGTRSTHTQKTFETQIVPIEYCLEPILLWHEHMIISLIDFFKWRQKNLTLQDDFCWTVHRDRLTWSVLLHANRTLRRYRWLSE